MKELFVMPALGYTADALEPAVSKRTMEFHYGKHLQTYVDNLNRLVAGSPFEGKPLCEIAAQADGAIGNNAGQVFNHTLYFEQFSPRGAETAPSARLEALIASRYGSREKMLGQLAEAAVGIFGSGWAWLTADADGRLDILQAPGADNPLRHGLRPLLTVDVWEHAYYLDYQNRRADYVAALWPLVDWDIVSARAEKELC